MIKNNLFHLLIISIFLIPSPASSQDSTDVDPFEFKVIVKPDTALIGDEVTVTIEVSYPEDIELTEPAVKQNDDNVTVKSGPEVSRGKSGGRNVDRYRFKIAAFSTGEVELPYFEFYYYDDEGNQNSRMAPIETVFIKSLLPDEAKADSLNTTLDNKDITPPKSLPLIWWPYAVGAAVVILLGLFFWYYLRRKAGLAGIPQKPPEPPFDVAIRRLNELERKKLPEHGKFKDFYVELSEIIRRYIDGRFEIPAAESTTFELRRILRHPEITRDQTKDILDMLSRSDMVKFAKQTPSMEIPPSDFQLVKKFVVDSKPKEEIEEHAEVKS